MIMITGLRTIVMSAEFPFFIVVFARNHAKTEDVGYLMLKLCPILQLSPFLCPKLCLMGFIASLAYVS